MSYGNRVHSRAWASINAKVVYFTCRGPKFGPSKILLNCYPGFLHAINLYNGLTENMCHSRLLIGRKVDKSEAKKFNLAIFEQFFNGNFDISPLKTVDLTHV